MSSGKDNAPNPPDYTNLANASLESAKIWEGVAKDQLDWAKTTDTANRDLLNKVLDVQLPQLQAAFDAAQKDRQRYETVFQPIEDKFVQQAVNYDTPERRAAEAASRVADVRTQFEAQRTNAQRQLEGYGIDPSQTRYAALDLGYRAQEAASSALAANQGRKQVEQTGLALTGEAINLGKGYPSQVAQSQGIVNQTAGGAVGNATGVTGAGVAAYGSAAPYAQLGMQGIGQSANITNMGYQNALDAYSANAAQSGGLWGGIGSLVGELGSAYIMRPKAEGGLAQEGIPGPPGLTDKIPAMLAKDEFVIPADVVRKKGLEFFDKLLDRYKDGGEYDAKRQEGIPSGK